MIAGPTRSSALSAPVLALDPFQAIDPQVATGLGIVCIGVGAGIASTHLLAVAVQRAAQPVGPVAPSGHQAALLATAVCLTVVFVVRTSEPAALVVTVGSVLVTLGLPVAVGVLTVQDLVGGGER